MRVLVTGGAGYVGCHVVRALLDAGHEPIILDNLSTGHAEATQGAELVRGEVGDRALLQKLLHGRRFDGVVHLAAYSVVSESVKNPSKYFNNNVINGLAFFDELVLAGVPWIVLSSTAAVYGDPAEVPIPETHLLKPTNPYGESKLMLETALKWYNRAYGFRSACLRYFNAAGAHPSGIIGEDHSPETHLIPIVMQAALGQRQVIDIFGTDYDTPDGTAIRDYVHVCDLASAHLAVMERLSTGFSGGIFNLGSQRGYSVLEIVEATRKVTGKDIPVRHGPRREGDPPVLVAESTRAHRELNWQITHSLDSIIQTAWQWHHLHPHGYTTH